MESLVANNRVLLVIHGNNISYIVNWSKVINDPIPSYSFEKLHKIGQLVDLPTDDNPYLTMLRFRFYEEEENKAELMGQYNKIDLIVEDCITPNDPSSWWDLCDNLFYEPYGSTKQITKLSKFTDIKAVVNDHGEVVMGDISEFGDNEWFNAW